MPSNKNVNEIVSSPRHPALREQKRTLRKPDLPPPSELPFLLRLLLGLQSWLTYFLLRTGVQPRTVTAAWFVVGLVGYSALAWGTTGSVLIGSLLIYVKIMLDLTDGEIGRHWRTRLSPAEDTLAHLKGVYLDRMQHVIESPLWGIALGWGVYRQTGNEWAVAAGLGIGLFRTFCRAERLLVPTIAVTFNRPLEFLVTGTPAGKQGSSRFPTFASRLLEKMDYWMRNGKRFNLMILLAGAADLVLSHWSTGPHVVRWLVYCAGSAGGVLIFAKVMRVQFSRELLVEQVWKYRKAQVGDDL